MIASVLRCGKTRVMELKNGGNPSPADIVEWKTDPSPTGSSLWPYYGPYILWSRLLYQLPVILPQISPSNGHFFGLYSASSFHSSPRIPLEWKPYPNITDCVTAIHERQCNSYTKPYPRPIKPEHFCCYFRS